MATARSYSKCALVIGVLSTAEERRAELLSVLEKNFGPIEMQSPSMDFSFTDYYDGEMGGRPKRYLLLFSRLVDPSDLADIKIRTNELEKLFATEEGKRHASWTEIPLSFMNVCGFRSTASCLFAKRPWNLLCQLSSCGRVWVKRSQTIQPQL